MIPFDRPETGKVTVGQTVIVYPSGSGSRRSAAKPVRCTVSKVGRVWIDVVPEDGSFLAHYDARFRMDTQGNGSDTGNYRARFLTEDQYAWEQRRNAVREFLREAGIQVGEYVRGLKYGEPSVPGRWYGREAELANLIRAHEGLDPL
jgi:hypothetical protein